MDMYKIRRSELKVSGRRRGIFVQAVIDGPAIDIKRMIRGYWFMGFWLGNQRGCWLDPTLEYERSPVNSST